MTSPSQEQVGAQIGRYKLLEQIGEGGMGTIWMAEQREPVKRRVALKIIKLGMDTKQVIARFEAERQALAMMDHPHIAKVLDAGATETGRPYFVMEYIKGIPILEYCDKERIDTSARLALFTNVCHAIQHAHHKGIIHRDIKPSNVLVTLHDGVPVPKVIDFGIAKATNSELTAKTLFTEHRQMVGTPAYMSPEQAEMSGLDIDTRSDIYSLGVLLYELLTGTTPFDAKKLLDSGFDEMLRAIREDEPHKPSTRISSLGDTGTRTAQQRRVELKKLSLLLRGDLDWIVMRCLEKDRTRRYETANGLAADIQRHLRDEPVSAGAPSAGYKLRKFVRRNRAKVIASSAVLAAVLIGTVGTSWGLVEKSRAHSAAMQRELEDEQRTAAESARRMRNAEVVRSFLDQCEVALRAGDDAKAKVALDAARQRALEGGAEDKAAQLDADLVLATELDAIEQFRWTWSGNQFGDPKIAASRTRAALAKFGADLATVSVEDAAARVEASAIRARIESSLDGLLSMADAEAPRAVLRRLDDDPFRNAYRDAVLERDEWKQTNLATDPAALEQPSAFVAALGQNRAIEVERRRELLEQALLRQPSDIVLLMTMQATFENSNVTFDERVRWLQAAVAADPQNSGAFTNLGLALSEQGRDDEALACYRSAVALNPTNAPACNNLGGKLHDMGELAEAVIWLEKSIAIAPQESGAYTNLGLALKKLGAIDAAIEKFQKAIEVAPQDAVAYGLLGDVLAEKGRVSEAIGSFRKAIELDPKYMAAHSQLGDLLEAAGKSDEAIACYVRTVELEPKTAWHHARLGDALRRKGRLDEAIACYRKAIEVDPKYDAHGVLGIALKNKGEIDEAIVHLRKSIELRPEDPAARQVLSDCLRNRGQTDEAISLAQAAVDMAPEDSAAVFALGNVLNSKGRIDESIACYQKAIELDPKNASAHHNLGATRVNMGQWEQALPDYRSATSLDPKRGVFRLDLALVLQHLGQHDEAKQSFELSLELDPSLAVAHYNLGIYLQEKRRWDDAIDRYQQAIALDPNYAEANCNMASCLQNKGRFEEALQFSRRGHELGSKRSDWRYPSAEWVKDAEMLAALEAKLPAVLEGKVKPSDNAERLECAKMCSVKELYRESVALAAEAFAVDAALAEDLDAGNRFNASIAAVMAAAGKGKDGAKLDDRERSRLRKQAVEWLRADLAVCSSRLESGKAKDLAAVQEHMRTWQGDEDLANLRDNTAAASLPLEERNALDQLWADEATLLAKAKMPPQSPR